MASDRRAGTGEGEEAMASGESMERLSPDELREILEAAPVAYVPLGTLEFHGWHLPLGFDALKVQALCDRLRERTGGVVLPPCFFGTGGGHRDYFGSIISEDELVRGNLLITGHRLIEMGFRVVVFLTGHYPTEQVELVHAVAEELAAAHPEAQVIGLAEPEAHPTEKCWDHAAKWETSLGMALTPDLVQMDRMAVHDDPIHGIYGEDPRETASAELGERTAEAIVSTLAATVAEALEDVQG
jgi:creatinine amidohydrolase